MERALNPVLVQALTVLAKEKPCAQPVEALTFLGQWLLDNNPSKVRHLHCACFDCIFLLLHIAFFWPILADRYW